MKIQASFNIKPDLLTQVDEARGVQSRSAFIVECIFERLTGPDADKSQLIKDIEAHKATEARLESEVAYLREQLSKINDALAQRLLTDNAHKKTLWQRIRGH
jgi:hypothetical protein